MDGGITEWAQSIGAFGTFAIATIAVVFWGVTKVKGLQGRNGRSLKPPPPPLPPLPSEDTGRFRTETSEQLRDVHRVVTAGDGRGSPLIYHRELDSALTSIAQSLTKLSACQQDQTSLLREQAKMLERIDGRYSSRPPGGE